MQPQSLTLRDVCQTIEVVEGTGVCRAGVPNNAEGMQACRTITCNSLFQDFYIYGKRIVHLNLAECVGPQPEKLHGLLDGTVRLIGCVKHHLLRDCR